MMLAGALTDRVLFPLYTKRPPSEGPENFAKISRARMLATSALFVLSAILAVSGDWLVQTLYDPRYHQAGPVLVLLSISLLPNTIVSSYPALMLAAGDSGRFSFYVTVTAFVRTAFLLYGAAFYGSAGVVLVPAVSMILIYPALVYLIRPYQGWDPRHDIMFGMLSVAIAVLALWVNQASVVAFLTEAGLLG